MVWKSNRNQRCL